MIGTIVYQLTRNLTPEQAAAAGFDAYFVDHTTGIYPTAASGSPWNAAGIGVTGDVIADLTGDMAADAAPWQGQPNPLAASFPAPP
jgi:spore coat protein JC